MSRYILNRRVFLAGSAAAGAVLVAGRAYAAPDKTIKVAHELPVDHPVHLGLTEAAKIVNDDSGGRIALQIFPSGQLGAGRDLVQQVSDGSLGLMMGGISALQAYDQAFTAFEAPFLARDLTHLQKMITSSWAKTRFDQVAKARNVRVAGPPWYYGTRHFTSNKRGFKVPADLQGMKLRVPDIKTYRAMVEAFGATATPMALAEVYLALQTGVTDGQENPLATIFSQKFQEVQKFLSLTGHVMVPFAVLGDEKMLTSLPEKDRAIIDKALAAGSAANDKAVIAAEASLVDKLRAAGMTVVESDRAAFKQVATSIYPKFAAEWGADTIATLQAL